MTDMTNAPVTDTPRAAGAVSRIQPRLSAYLRRVVAALVGLCALVALPGTALATTEPITPGSGADLAQSTVSRGASSSWGSATLLAGLVLVVLLAAAVAAIQRIARQRRTARPTALHA